VSDEDGSHSHNLVAFYGRGPLAPPEISPAPRWRDWMNATPARGANRCLPLLIANESGWVLKNPAPVSAVWDGSDGRDGVQVRYDAACPIHHRLATSNFGSGVLTWAVPYLFRTPPGVNLLVRGPANWPKDGICALDGLVETDWSVATFTMNWKITRPHHPVSFDEGEPFCMLVPQRRGELARFEPEFALLESDEASHDEHAKWVQGRHDLQVRRFLGQYSRDFQEHADAWERRYFKGLHPGGEPALEHESKLRLREFSDPV
jgi:hypothetical protein